MRYLAEWTAQSKRSPFAGVWRVRQVPDDSMFSIRPGVVTADTRAGIKQLLHGMGNGHPIRFAQESRP